MQLPFYLSSYLPLSHFKIADYKSWVKEAYGERKTNSYLWLWWLGPEALQEAGIAEGESWCEWLIIAPHFYQPFQNSPYVISSFDLATQRTASASRIRSPSFAQKNIHSAIFFMQNELSPMSAASLKKAEQTLHTARIEHQKYEQKIIEHMQALSQKTFFAQPAYQLLAEETFNKLLPTHAAYPSPEIDFKWQKLKRISEQKLALQHTQSHFAQSLSFLSNDPTWGIALEVSGPKIRFLPLILQPSKLSGLTTAQLLTPQTAQDLNWVPQSDFWQTWLSLAREQKKSKTKKKNNKA